MQSIIHGRIVLGNEHQRSIEVIQSLKEDGLYPWIRPKMFSLGEIKSPFYYDDPVIAFAASYKYYDWPCFLIKLECLLMKIDFISVKMQLESEFEGHFNFYWKSKKYNSVFDAEERFIETEKWFFGVGHRDIWGYLLEDLDASPFPIQPIGFTYPYEFNKNGLYSLNKFFELILNEPFGKRLFINSYISKNEIGQGDDRVDPILTMLKWKGFIDYDYEIGKGYWVEKIKNIEKIDSIAQNFIQGY